MKINKRVFSIPPYLSTSWETIQAISMENEVLQIILADGASVEIPHLEQEVIDQVFATHADVLEQRPFEELKSHDSLFQIGFAAVDELGSVMQHNPAQKNAPDLPAFVIEKIGALAKAIAPDDIHSLPEAEQGCNCAHCQIARAIIEDIQFEPLKADEEEVSTEDLSFNQWNIEETAKDIFLVSNKLDATERYSVFLGHPVGCSCGSATCEHIIAVLKS